MSITLEQFNEQVKPLQISYAAKEAELNAIRDQFEDLVNKIKLVNAFPEDDEVEDFEEQDEAWRNEVDEISDTVGDLLYEFGLEWDGSFSEGVNDFWTPSTC